MSLDQVWCKSVDERINALREDIQKLQGSSDQLIKVVVIALLTIVGAVVGVKVIP